MMYSEFLELTKQDITFKQYTEVIEPMYNAVEDMSKQAFIEFMLPSIKAMAKANAEAKAEAERAKQELVFLSDGSRTPNNCYYLGEYAMLVSKEADIRTGKKIIKVRELTDEEERELRKSWDTYLSYSVDFYTNDDTIRIKWVK